MSKKILVGFVAVFVTTQVIEGLVDFYFLDPVYVLYAQIWRPLAEMKLWILPLVGISFSFFFVYIFSKGYEGKGWAEGVRFGMSVALMVVLPGAYSRYALMQIPYPVVLQWLAFGVFEYVTAGVVLAGVFKLKLDSTDPH